MLDVRISIFIYCSFKNLPASYQCFENSNRFLIECEWHVMQGRCVFESVERREAKEVSEKRSSVEKNVGIRKGVSVKGESEKRNAGERSVEEKESR